MDSIRFNDIYDLERVKEPEDLLKNILLIADGMNDNKKDFISIAFHYILGYNLDEIKASFPHLSLTQINDFLQIVEIRLGVNWVEILKLRVLNKGMEGYLNNISCGSEGQVLDSESVLEKYFDFINLE